MEHQKGSVIHNDGESELFLTSNDSGEQKTAGARQSETGRYLCAAGGPGRGADPFSGGPTARDLADPPDFWPYAAGDSDLQMKLPELFGNQAERPPPGAGSG